MHSHCVEAPMRPVHARTWLRAVPQSLPVDPRRSTTGRCYLACRVSQEAEVVLLVALRTRDAIAVARFSLPTGCHQRNIR